MKNILRAVVVSAALATALAAPGVANATTARAGATVVYEFTADAVKNTIKYTGKDGKAVSEDVRFVPLPIGFSREQYGYKVRVRMAKTASVQSKVDADVYATCTITLDGRQVAYQRMLQGGIARC